jgi:WD40 repeat protein
MYARVMLLSAMVSCISMSAMDFFKTVKDQTFSIVSQEGMLVPVRYEDAVQIEVLRPLCSSQKFKSQHAVKSIKSFMRALYHTKKGTLNTYLKGMPDAERLPVSIEKQLCEVRKNSNITNKKKIRFVVQNLKDLHKENGEQNEKSIYAVLSVAHELKATEFAMVCMSHLINLDGQRQLFSLMVPVENLSTLQKSLDKYIVEKTAIEKRQKNLDDHDRFLSQCAQSSTKNPCNNKMIRNIKGRIEIYDKTTKKPLLTLAQKVDYMSCASFSRDGSKIACIIDDTFYVWNANRGELLHKEEIGPDFSRGIYLALSKDGDRAVVVGQYANFLHTDASCVMVLDIKEAGKMEMLYSCDNILHMTSLYVRDDNKIVFYDKQHEIMYGDSWNLNKGQEIISQLNCAELAFLYQLDELAASKKSLLPVMTGFVRKYVHTSLPKILRGWVEDKLDEIHNNIK